MELSHERMSATCRRRESASKSIDERDDALKTENGVDSSDGLLFTCGDKSPTTARATTFPSQNHDHHGDGPPFSDRRKIGN